MLSVQPIDAQYSDECLAILQKSFDVPWSEVESIIRSKNNVVLGAFSNHQLVGFAVASVVADEGEVLMCAVNPDFQRQGIGSLLVGGVLDECGHRRVSNFFLEVDVTNVAAKALYEKFGFLVVGKRKAYYQSRDGTFSDALVMRCGDL